MSGKFLYLLSNLIESSIYLLIDLSTCPSVFVSCLQTRPHTNTRVYFICDFRYLIKWSPWPCRQSGLLCMVLHGIFRDNDFFFLFVLHIYQCRLVNGSQVKAFALIVNIDREQHIFSDLSTCVRLSFANAFTYTTTRENVYFVCAFLSLKGDDTPWLCRPSGLLCQVLHRICWENLIFVLHVSCTGSSSMI